jgi:hypothetical protein
MATGILAVLAALLEIIAYILKTGPSKTDAEVIQGIWASRKEKRDSYIIKKQDDKLSMDVADITRGIDQLREKDSDGSGK